MLIRFGILRDMSVQFEEIEKQAKSLPPKEKAALARLLIEELDEVTDPDADRLWIEEAERRHAAYLRGELQAVSGDEAMHRARARLK